MKTYIYNEFLINLQSKKSMKKSEKHFK